MKLSLLLAHGDVLLIFNETCHHWSISSPKARQASTRSFSILLLQTQTQIVSNRPSSSFSAMKFAAALTVFAAMFAASTSAQESTPSRASNIAPLILSGTVVPAGTKTYTTGLRFTATDSTVCGGSLISPTHVLSAAHCSGGIKFVAVGTHFKNGSADGERIQVKREIIHPNYTFGNDFMILELASPSKFAPVALAAADDSDAVAGAAATVMGWGITSLSGPAPYELLGVNVPILSNAQCSKILTIDSSMLCAGGVRDKDSCRGDSGGPLVVSKGGKDVLIGVVSWGSHGCGAKGYPGVYARVSSARSWIDSVIRGGAR